MEIISEVVSIKNSDITKMTSMLKDIDPNKFNIKVDNHSIYFSKLDSKFKSDLQNIFNYIYGKENSKIMTNALLYAYYIHMYQTDIFFYYTSNIENRLLSYAKEVTKDFSNLYKTLTNKSLQKFSADLEHFNALLSVWNSKDKMRKFRGFIDDIKELSETYSVFIKLDPSNRRVEEYRDKIFSEIKKYININRNLTVKFMFDNFEILTVDDVSRHTFWDIIKMCYDTNFKYVMLLGLSTIRHKLVKRIDNRRLAKELLYYIDIDDLISKMRHDEDIDKIVDNYMDFIAKCLNIECESGSRFDKLKQCYTAI